MKHSLVIYISFIGSILCAQDFSVAVSPDTVLIGNSLKLTFILENIDGKFSPPEFQDMDVVSGPNSSSSVSIINGAKTSKKSYSFYLKPKVTGKLVIPPASLMTETDLKESEELIIIVKENPNDLIIAPEEKGSGRIMDLRSFNLDFPFGGEFKEKKKTKPEKKERKLKKI